MHEQTSPGPSTGAALQGGNAAARREAARVMGQATTEAKARAAQENGRRGGRPKGTPTSAETRRKMSESKRRRDAARASRARGQEEGGASA